MVVAVLSSNCLCSKSWSVFKRKALEVQEAFLLHFPDIVVEINSSAPRRGAFEIVVTNSRGVGMMMLLLPYYMNYTRAS